MILTNVWKSRVNIKKFIIDKKLTQIRIMSSDRKRTGQENNLGNDNGN